MVGFLAGGTLTGGHGSNTVSALRTDGLIEYPSDGTLCLTDAGRAQARAPSEALTPETIQARVMQQTGGLGARIVAELVAVYPDDLSREEVGERTTAAVVQGIFLVIVLDAFFAVFFTEIGWT